MGAAAASGFLSYRKITGDLAVQGRGLFGYGLGEFESMLHGLGRGFFGDG